MAPKLTMAIGDRFDTQHLLSGRVKVQGFDIGMINPGRAPSPIFNSMVTTIPYDIGELAMSNYVIARDQGVSLAGIPVFPSLFFPITGMTKHSGSGISTLADFGGKRVGVPLGFASNPAVWLRGILSHQWDVSPESITWVEGPQESLAGIPYPRSRRFRSEKVDDVSGELADGKIDAMIVAGGNARTSNAVVPLLQDPYPAFREYYQTTGVLPINTVLVARPQTLKENPGLAEAVLTACNKARAMYHKEESSDAIHQGLKVGELRSMNLFPDHYSLARYRTSVRMMVQYLYEQNLIRTLFEPEDLFVL